MVAFWPHERVLQPSDSRAQAARLFFFQAERFPPDLDERDHVSHRFYELRISLHCQRHHEASRDRVPLLKAPLWFAAQARFSGLFHACQAGGKKGSSDSIRTLAEFSFAALVGMSDSDTNIPSSVGITANGTGSHRNQRCGTACAAVPSLWTGAGTTGAGAALGRPKQVLLQHHPQGAPIPLCGHSARQRQAWEQAHRSRLGGGWNRRIRVVDMEVECFGQTTSKACHAKKKALEIIQGLYSLAERVGFEPTVVLPLRLISSQVHSTTLPPLLHSCRSLRL